MDSNISLITSSMTELSVESTSDDHKYSRHSFDRFGDDLCELLLSYLTFKDKIVLEDVCRQWKRTIYDKQTVLRVFTVDTIEAIPLDEYMINYYRDYCLNDLTVPIKIKNYVTSSAYNQNMRTFDINRLKSLLNKCKYIKKIELNRVYIDGPLLELIAQMCPNLQSIQLELIGLEEEDIISFGQKYGPNLHRIQFNNIQEIISSENSHNLCAEFGRKLLSFCTNIKSFHCQNISLVNETSVAFLPKLESIELNLRQNDSINFKLFIDKYENRLKKLDLFTAKEDSQMLKNAMEQISRLKNIEELWISINFRNNEAASTIIDNLANISKNCRKITRFNLRFFNREIEYTSATLWECLSTFSNLRQLTVMCQLLQNDETIETLKPLKHLTHLSIVCYKMGDPFFKDIHLFLPDLKTFHLTSHYDLSDTFIESLSKLKNLTEISIVNRTKALRLITDLGISVLLDNCPKLRSIEFFSRPNITAKTIDNLITFGNKNSKNKLLFYCDLPPNGEESQFAAIDRTAYTYIPNNLTIII